MNEPGMVIRIDMDRPCTRCGEKNGTAENGLCLECLRKGIETMAPDQQLSLTTEYVELTNEEKIERGFVLASLLREAQVMADEHAERKKDMKDEREALEERIATLAMILRTGKEERPVGVSR